MRKSVPSGEKSGGVVLPLVVSPSPLAVSLPEKERVVKMVMFSAGSL